jgi:hypothetical protein
MVGAVNSAATLIASRYEAARSSQLRAPLLIHYHIFKNAGASRPLKRLCPTMTL